MRRSGLTVVLGFLFCFGAPLSAAAAEASSWVLIVESDVTIGRGRDATVQGGTLDLGADRTYTLSIDGSLAPDETGAWFQDRRRLIFVSDNLLERLVDLESRLADELGEPVEVVPLSSKSKAVTIGRGDELRVKSQSKGRVRLLDSNRVLRYRTRSSIEGLRVPAPPS